MSSECKCHIPDASCFYCEVYSPEVERLTVERDAQIKRAEEAEESAYSLITDNTRLYRERDEWRAEAKAATLRADAAGWEVVGYEEENEAMHVALREIDTHIRGTSDPIPHIVATLKRVLPEYAEESGDPFADEEVSADGSTQETGE